MRRMKRYVAFLMAVCMLSFGNSYTGINVNAEGNQAGYQYCYTELVSGEASGEASGNGTAAVSIVDIENNVEEVLVPAVYVSADAQYDVTSLKELSFVSGEASGNALKMVSFAGDVPAIADTVSLNGYYAKVLKDKASGDAYDKLVEAVGEGNVYPVSSIDNKIMTVTEPTEYKNTLGEVANAIVVKDLLSGNQCYNTQFNWYEDEELTKGLSASSLCESDVTYYYKAVLSGYEDVTGSISLSSNTFTVESGNCILTCKITTDSSNTNAEKTVTITSAAYKEGYTLNKADIMEIPANVKEESTGTEYKVTAISSNAFNNAYFTSYYIPVNVKTIESNAFPADYNDKNVLLLRFAATTKEELPAIYSNFNTSRFGLVFANTVGEDVVNSWKNEKANSINSNYKYFVNSPATDKILYGGNVAAADSALYTNHLSDVVISANGFTDFQTGAEVIVSGGWNNPGYPFSFADGATDQPYTYGADGYGNQVTGTKRVTPYAADGFTFDALNGAATLSVAGYRGNLTEVTVPDAEMDATGATYLVTAVSGSFNGDWNLKKITLGNNINEIKSGAFNNCKYLEINVLTSNPTFLSVNGFLYSKDMSKLIAAPSASGTTYLPEGITVIGDYALYNNKRIQTLVLPTTVVKIGESNNARCFQGCDQLETIKFCNSTNISTLTFMGSVFSGALKEIFVPVGTTAAYETALKNSSVWYNATIKEWYPTTNIILTLSNFDAVTVTPTDTTKAYNWTSDNTGLVAVEPSQDGKSAQIHAVNYSGIANVTAVAPDGTSTSWQVTVNIGADVANPYAVDAYTLTATKSKVTMGVTSGKKKDQAVITIGASNGSAITIASVKTSKKKVATVSKKGSKITITSGTKKGTANITVTDSLGKTKVIKVTVKAAPKKATLKKKSVTIKKGKTYAIALKNTVSAKLTFKSSKKKVATVTADGVVKAKKKGSCKITVTTYNGKKATLKVKVKK